MTQTDSNINTMINNIKSMEHYEDLLININIKNSSMFIKERMQIEAIYLKSLTKLYEKYKQRHQTNMLTNLSIMDLNFQTCLTQIDKHRLLLSELENNLNLIGDFKTEVKEKHTIIREDLMKTVVEYKACLNEVYKNKKEYEIRKGKTIDQKIHLLENKDIMNKQERAYRSSIAKLEIIRLNQIQNIKRMEVEYNEIIKLCLLFNKTVAKSNLNTASLTMEHTTKYCKLLEKELEAFSETKNKHCSVFCTNFTPVYFQGDLREHKHLIFGVSLYEYVYINKTTCPEIVKYCIEHIEERGLLLEGIYRKSTKISTLIDLKEELETKPSSEMSLIIKNHNVYTISCLLKVYFRMLPTNLLQFGNMHRTTYSLIESVKKRLDVLRAKLSTLSDCNYATLRILMFHLNKVAKYSNSNKMSPENLAIIFSPVLFNDYELDCLNKSDDQRAKQYNITEDMIKHAASIFSTKGEQHFDDKSPVVICNTKNTEENGLWLMLDKTSNSNLKKTKSRSIGHRLSIGAKSSLSIRSNTEAFKLIDKTLGRKFSEI